VPLRSIYYQTFIYPFVTKLVAGFRFCYRRFPVHRSFVLWSANQKNRFFPLSQSLYWRPPADQKASGLWVRDCAGIFNRFPWARNDKAADQSGSFITSLSSHIQDSKMAVTPGSTFLAHFKDCILLRSNHWIVFCDLWSLRTSIPLQKFETCGF